MENCNDCGHKLDGENCSAGGVHKPKTFAERFDEKRVKRKAYMTAYHIRNRDKETLQRKEWSLKNREKEREYRRKYYNERSKTKRLEYQKLYYLNNKDSVIANQRLRYAKYGRTPKEKIDNSMSFQMWRFLKQKKGGKRWQELAGYSLEQLMTHLQNRFDSKMTWDNYGSYWHIDHIKPASLFHYNFPDETEFKECWSLSNLQPLEAIANIKKGNKYAMSTM